MTAFVVFALPRSGTFWLSRFLSYGSWVCGWDELQHMRSLEDVKTWFTQPDIGSVETAAAPHWRLLYRYQPHIRIATVRRSVGDVLASLARAANIRVEDVPADTVAQMQRLDRKLDQIERRIPGVVSIPFEHLRTEVGCARLFEHLLQAEHDRTWWASWQDQYICGDLLAQARYCQAYLPQLEKLARSAKQQTLAGMRRARPPDGFTFQEEAFDQAYEDARPLIQQHMIATGQEVDAFEQKDIGMLRGLDAVGALQTVTARSNGRVFAYRVTVISPWLEKAGTLAAEHLPIFASPDCPGLGMKLQRFADDTLRAKGVAVVMGRAGTIGTGPRQGAMYLRQGYQEFGALYRRDLEAA